MGRARIGQWYTRWDNGETFQVIELDSAGTIEMRTFDGDLFGTAEAVWSLLPLGLTDSPRDWVDHIDEAKRLAETLDRLPPADWTKACPPAGGIGEPRGPIRTRTPSGNVSPILMIDTRLPRPLNGLEIAHKPAHAIARLSMRLLVLRVVSIEVITPHRHMPMIVEIDTGLSIDDLVDFILRESAIPSCGDQGQVRRRHFEIRASDTITARVRAVAGSAVRGKKLRAGLGVL